MKYIIITLIATLLLSCNNGVTRSEIKIVQDKIESPKVKDKFQETFDEDGEIKVGQVWLYIQDDENPFEKTIIDTCYVLDVKGDYVQWKQDGIIRNDKKYWFRVAKTRIK